MSSARRVGENWLPILVPTRPRITASWTRRVPCTTISRTMMARCPPGPGSGCWGCCGWAEAMVGTRRRTKKMERRALPRWVMCVSGPPCRDSAFGGSVVGAGQPRLRDLRFPKDEIIPLHVELEPRPVRDLATDDRLGERILYLLLNRAPAPAGAGRRI